MPKALLPWLFPVGLIIAVLVAIAGGVVGAIVALVACYLAVPVLYATHRRYRESLQRDSESS
jgi:hypothetical protein